MYDNLIMTTKLRVHRIHYFILRGQPAAVPLVSMLYLTSMSPGGSPFSTYGRPHTRFSLCYETLRPPDDLPIAVLKCCLPEERYLIWLSGSPNALLKTIFHSRNLIYLGIRKCMMTPCIPDHSNGAVCSTRTYS